MDEKKVKPIYSTGTYAESLKSKKMHIVKSINEGQKAANNKKLVMGNTKTPVETFETTKDRQLTLRFTDRQNLEVEKKLQEDTVHESSVTEKRKMKPKFKIT